MTREINQKIWENIRLHEDLSPRVNHGRVSELHVELSYWDTWRTNPYKWNGNFETLLSGKGKRPFWFSNDTMINIGIDVVWEYSSIDSTK